MLPPVGDRAWPVDTLDRRLCMTPWNTDMRPLPRVGLTDARGLGFARGSYTSATTFTDSYSRLTTPSSSLSLPPERMSTMRRPRLSRSSARPPDDGTAVADDDAAAVEAPAAVASATALALPGSGVVVGGLLPPRRRRGDRNSVGDGLPDDSAAWGCGSGLLALSPPPPLPLPLPPPPPPPPSSPSVDVNDDADAADVERGFRPKASHSPAPSPPWPARSLSFSSKNLACSSVTPKVRRGAGALLDDGVWASMPSSSHARLAWLRPSRRGPQSACCFGCAAYASANDVDTSLLSTSCDGTTQQQQRTTTTSVTATATATVNGEVEYRSRCGSTPREQ